MGQYSTWSIILGFGVIIGIIVSILIIDDRIEKRIEKRISDKLKDPEVLNQIANHVRPSLIFNHSGTVRIDSGASQFIKEI